MELQCCLFKMDRFSIVCEIIMFFFFFLPLCSALAAPASDWLTGLHSPLIQEDGEEKKLKLRFDVAQYTPEEIVVKTVDNKLLVHAKHEEKSETKSVYREYNREFLLPKGTNPELIRSSLSKVSFLTHLPVPSFSF